MSTKQQLTQEAIRLRNIIALYVVKQWFHSIFALVNTNRPDGLSGRDYYEVANQIQELAWKSYCKAGDELRKLEQEC